MGAVFGMLAIVGALAAIAYPLWRPEPDLPPDPIGPVAELNALLERKQAIYAAIRDLGFDYRTDRLSQADYQQEVEQLKAEAVKAVRDIEELRSAPPRGPQGIEREIAAAREQLPPIDAPTHPQVASYCTQCGRPADSSDRFCAACGTQLRPTT
ncbi:MAG: zinc ribbon domain-containing protein [Acidobacteriota bacterium]